MPAILSPEDYETWLDPGINDGKAVLDCLELFDASLMKKYPVSNRVNHIVLRIFRQALRGPP